MTHITMKLSDILIIAEIAAALAYTALAVRLLLPDGEPPALPSLGARSPALPEGTVSYCLNDKRFFEQLESGDWNITESSRQGLERKAKTSTFQMEQR